MPMARVRRTAAILRQPKIMAAKQAHCVRPIIWITIKRGAWVRLEIVTTLDHRSHIVRM